MPHIDLACWTDHLRNALRRYDEPLLRQVSEKLIKPRSQWPAEELVERCTATIGNAAVIDRRLHALEPSSRRLLAVIGQSRQPRWKLGNLIEILAVLEPSADVRPILALFEAGLLYPVLPGMGNRIKNFEQWIGASGPPAPEVFAHPLVTDRARSEDLGLPVVGVKQPVGATTEADGLDWPLRLAVLWQLVTSGALRLTQQGDFFKRDLERLRGDPMLNASSNDNQVGLIDAGLLAVDLALIEGALLEEDGELRAVPKPPDWDRGLPDILASLWAAVSRLVAWNPRAGWQGRSLAANPFPSAQLLTLLLLARTPKDEWSDAEMIAQWVVEHHPYWGKSFATSLAKGDKKKSNGTTSRAAGAATEHDPSSALLSFLLGVAYPLRMLQVARDEKGKPLARLSPLGRWILGMEKEPAGLPSYPQTLLVQPNLEIIAYRQGLTPALIARLGMFAAWKSLGAACILQFQPETVYRALESGLSFDGILQTLEQHGMKPTPTAVVESLRTWSNKRERLTIYPAATLFEFATTDDLNEALVRGLPGVRLTERLAVVANEGTVDFRHFRLTGTRDYGLPPERCVEVAADGVSLDIDQAKSDLMLETEIRRFAAPVDLSVEDGRSRYRLTPASLSAGLRSGLTVQLLEEWFHQRTGQPMTPSARLLLNGSRMSPVEIRSQLVLYVAAPETADGLLQWPETAALIEDRLGPLALLVAEENVEELRKQLGKVGLEIEG